MASLVLITGASRSGKSRFAQTLAESLSSQRIYVATCPHIPGDKELAERIQKHQEERKGHHWTTIEEPTDLGSIFQKFSFPSVILVDCLTLWINNLMWEKEKKGERFTEEDTIQETTTLLHTIHTSQAQSIILVTNEVGWGIIPDNPLSRRYRDCVGRCNAMIAQEANAVILMVCSLPMWVKGSLSSLQRIGT